jgi:AcrR family transcriptional regulator
MARTADPRSYEALLDAARTEFARHGPEQARVEDIASRAGVSKGAFYLHFRTKHDAFEVILQRFFGALEDHARRRQALEREAERLAASGAPPAEALELQVRADVELLELLWSHRQILAGLDGAGGRFWARFTENFRERMRALVAGRILERQGEGHLRRDVDPGVVADVLVGTLEDFGRRMAGMRQKPDFAAWSRSLLTILYEGLVDRSALAVRSALTGRSGSARQGAQGAPEGRAPDGPPEQPAPVPSAALTGR